MWHLQGRRKLPRDGLCPLGISDEHDRCAHGPGAKEVQQPGCAFVNVAGQCRLVVLHLSDQVNDGVREPVGLVPDRPTSRVILTPNPLSGHAAHLGIGQRLPGIDAEIEAAQQRGEPIPVPDPAAVYCAPGHEQNPQC